MAGLLSTACLIKKPPSANCARGGKFNVSTLTVVSVFCKPNQYINSNKH